MSLIENEYFTCVNDVWELTERGKIQSEGINKMLRKMLLRRKPGTKIALPTSYGRCVFAKLTEAGEVTLELVDGDN